MPRQSLATLTLSIVAADPVRAPRLRFRRRRRHHGRR